MSTPESVVRELLDSLAAGDVDRAVDLLDADVEWRNTYLPTFRGPQVAANLRDMVGRGIGFEVQWHHVAAEAAVDDPESGIVLTDRTDVLTYGRWTSEFWCRGTFEVRSGKVLVWDDAFSWVDVLGSGLVNLGRSLLPG
jgi:limonene-1,2-epoxide hydrolase